MKDKDFLNFKKLLEYFISHLEWIVNNDSSFIGYQKYIEPFLKANKFKITGQGYNGGKIQKQIFEWDHFEGNQVCINITFNQRIGYQSKFCYLNWIGTGINIIAEWKDNHIVGLYQELFIEKQKPQKSIWKNLNMSNSVEELGLFYESDKINENLKSFYENFRSELIKHQYKENHKKYMEKIEKKIRLLEYKKQIILQGPPGTGKTREAKLIAKEILGLNSTDDLKDNEQFKLIQFHPSYTYEDFVRGIVAESKGDKIEYKNVNKTLGEFAEVALKNYTTSKETGIDNNLDSWIDTQFELFKEDIKAQLPENEIPLSGDITIYDVADNSFKYGKNWKTASHILFGEFKSLARAVIKNELELSNKQMDKEKFRHAHYRYTYYNALLEKFFQEYKYESSGELIKEKKYILVIDEINRANLSSVLGELIYALEYRNESVHSPYGIKDENNKVKTELILPPNLYIIGTMNTADRSVGHIDYAIRRRFAFVEVLPEKLNDEKIIFHEDWFKKVSELFITNYDKYFADEERKVILQHSKTLSSEFRPEDVWIGHSYFIQKKLEDNKLEPEEFRMKIDYEIKPILMEYVKDGVLVGNVGEQKIEDYIKNL